MPFFERRELELLSLSLCYLFRPYFPSLLLHSSFLQMLAIPKQACLFLTLRAFVLASASAWNALYAEWLVVPWNLFSHFS